MSAPFFKSKIYWNRILNLGVDGDLSPLETRQVQTVNGLNLVALLVLCTLMVVNFIYLGFPAVVIDVIGILIVGLTYWLNYNKAFLAARILSYFMGTLLATLLASYNAVKGRPLMTEIVIVAYAPAAILYFDNWLKRFAYLFNVACYMVVFGLRYTYFEGDKELYFFNINLITTAYIIGFAVANVYKNAYISNQNSILEKNIELVRQKRELSVQADKLADLNKLKDRFLSIISHDLRSPLHALTSLLEMVEKEHISREEFRMIISNVTRSANETRDLLENLLNWAHSQLNQEGLTLAPFNVLNVTERTLEPLKRIAEKKGIEIQTNISGQLMAWGHDTSISLVIRNLVANAIKFSYPNSAIQLETSMSSECITVTVRDSGVGISPEELNRLFCASKLSTPGTLNERGTGLGLYLSHDFIEKNGGSLWAESTLGVGSSFHFTISNYSVEHVEYSAVINEEAGR